MTTRIPPGRLAIPLLIAHAAAAFAAEPLYLHCIGLNPNGDLSTIRLLTLRVRSGEDIEFAADGPCLVSRLKGRVEFRDAKFFAHLNAKVSINSGEFSGEVEPDKRFAPEWFSGSGIYQFAFALSHNPDPAPLLKEPTWKDAKPK